ncbi:hypothetical protein BFT35_10340 [Thermoanaerobacterium thermosaccharolyticum]|uniref:hypothetical protein n=1 Tax=Thermoanaerobacterium thermosaccharolyticum TaxID=1517 RepID=UPI000C079146|nr:hypothetical protein [Thermoanaerobacterium thermosaccharolyticum]PHO06651.1 hypothetical protein BFT35_10340 [Thermoanaerobacterium thermosaccharolyticum]
MIEPLYKRNDDIDKNTPTVTSYYRYKAILQFLYNIEILAPEAIDDLYPIAKLLDEEVAKNKEAILEKVKDRKKLFRDLKRLQQLNEEDFKKIFDNSIHNKEILLEKKLLSSKKLFNDYTVCSMYYILFMNDTTRPAMYKFAESLYHWVQKYNLNNANSFYADVAILAILKTIGVKYGYRIIDEVCYEINIPIEIIKKRENTNYISLSRGLVFDNCYSDYKKLGLVDMDEIYPFVFIPDISFEDNTDFYKLFYMSNRYDFLINRLKKYITQSQTMETYFRKILQDFIKDNDKTKKNLNVVMKPQMAWDPRKETWDEFEKKIDELYTQYKEIYKKEIEDFFKDNDYIPGKGKYEDSHFEWFVRYQVQGWSKEKIAREYHVTRQSVTNAIDEIGDLVGLKPRPTSKGGRPKKG